MHLVQYSTVDIQTIFTLWKLKLKHNTPENNAYPNLAIPTLCPPDKSMNHFCLGASHEHLMVCPH